MKTPKEKAKHLYDRFYFSKISTNKFRKEEAKNSSIICVEEIRSLMINLHGRQIENNLEEIAYWEEVKKELELL